ncbi:MAG: histidinol-phosphate transaminase [Candidatus Ozemobacteraceae bacterium]
MNSDFSVPLDRLVPIFVRGFSPYFADKPDAELMKFYGCSRLLRLNNNENPLGPPLAARHALEEFSSRGAAIYPNADSFDLRHRLSEVFWLPPDQFLVGSGANEILGFVIRSFCQSGDNIVTADRTFSAYESVARFSGIEARLTPLKDFEFDEKALLAAIDEKTKLIFICNPNNPTGTWWSKERLYAFMDRIAGRRIVVLDEAYAEFVERSEFPDGMKLIDQYPNLLVFRTFSKMYGLAGLRIGYIVGSREVVEIVRRASFASSINTPAQITASLALGDPAHIFQTREMVRIGKEYLLREFRRMGLNPIGEEGNFLMIRVPMNDALVFRKLMLKGIMVRTMTGFRFPNHIRISIGELPAMQALVEALEGILWKNANAEQPLP